MKAMNDFARPYSGYAELIGYELIERARDFARLRLVLEPQHMNRLGIPHGGLIASLLDTAAGFAVVFRDGSDHMVSAVTLSLSLHFLGQARLGDTLIAEGRRQGGGKSIAFANARVSTAAGVEIARAEGVFKYLKPSTPGKDSE